MLLNKVSSVRLFLAYFPRFHMSRCTHRSFFNSKNLLKKSRPYVPEILRNALLDYKITNNPPNTQEPSRSLRLITLFTATSSISSIICLRTPQPFCNFLAVFCKKIWY